MNKYSQAFRKAMKRIIGTNWNFDCYSYNDYHFTDVKHLPKSVRDKVAKKYKLDGDDIVTRYISPTSKYRPLNDEWIKCINDYDVVD